MHAPSGDFRRSGFEDMNFSFSEEQQLLADTARSYARERFGSAAARAWMAGEWKDFDSVWRELGEMGWLGPLVPEDLGGGGGSIVDACILLEELARALAPVPFEGHAIVAASALRWLGEPELAATALSELVAGRRFSVVLDSELGWPGGMGAGMAWHWSRDAIALRGEGDALRVLESDHIAPIPGQDLLHVCGRVDGAGPAIDPDFARGEAARRFLAIARVATCASLVGTMAGVLDLTTGHASQREQFGRKIGSFQSVAHICADMLVDLESSRSALYGAAWAVDQKDIDQAVRQATVAKAWCAAAGRRVCESAVQVHGGIGCAWESDVHRRDRPDPARHPREPRARSAAMMGGALRWFARRWEAAIPPGPLSPGRVRDRAFRRASRPS
jgi:alkylation response protein AidB-like acyl-CoA dehydrogenase